MLAHVFVTDISVINIYRKSITNKEMLVHVFVTGISVIHID